MNINSGTFAKKHKKEIASLRQGGKGRYLKFLLPVLFVVIVLSLFAPSSHRDERGGKTLQYSWAQDFQESQSRYLDWLLHRGTSTEVMVFQNVSEAIFRSGMATGSAASGYESLGALTRGVLAIHFAILRLAFFIIASLRLWIVLVAGGFVYGLRGIAAYRKDDLLGQTGNGRLFYSGINVTLDSLDESGVPSNLIAGLACPKYDATQSTMNSPLGLVLQKWGVANETNVSLARIIQAYASYPSYAASSEDSQFAGTYAGSTLGESVHRILESALMLHDIYLNKTITENPFPASAPKNGSGKPIALPEHILGLQRALHRALTPAMRREISQFPRAEVATLVLGYEAGKVLAYSQEAGRWIRKSAFVQLCSRAVLHSIPAYGHEYTASTRTRIRQAIIYGSRFSVFGPVRFPLNLSLPARSARQWVEVLMALPHELEAVSNEVELFGMVQEAHAGWENLFFSGVMAIDPAAVEDVYATNTGLFLVPVAKLVRLLHQVIPQEMLTRMEELVTAVSQMQRIQAMSADFAADPSAAGEKNELPAYQRIFGPLTTHEIKHFAELHGLSPRDVRDWSTLRIVLNSYGWLARRVGNSAVPEASIVFAVLKSVPGADSPRIGFSGMVPFRGTKLQDKWGRFWHSRFTLVESAAMAESKEDFDKLLSGIEEKFDDEGNVIGA